MLLSVVFFTFKRNEFQQYEDYNWTYLIIYRITAII